MSPLTDVLLLLIVLFGLLRMCLDAGGAFGLAHPLELGAVVAVLPVSNLLMYVLFGRVLFGCFFPPSPRSLHRCVCLSF